MIKVYWACLDNGNVGDAASKWIAEKITGQKVVHNHLTEPHFFIVGSILWEATPYTTVLGAGFGEDGQRVNPEANIVFVRGPLTVAELRKQGLTAPYLGDPALVCPYLYMPPVPKKRYKLGVIPHYVDLDKVKVDPAVKVVSPLLPVEKFINELSECERIISSSLHGIIFAHAYGIPATWAEFSDGVYGKGFKFRDYFLSVGLPLVPPVDLRKSGVITPDFVSLVSTDAPSVSSIGIDLKETLEHGLRHHPRV